MGPTVFKPITARWSVVILTWPDDVTQTPRTRDHPARYPGSPYLTGAPPIQPLLPAHPEPADRRYGARAATRPLAAFRHRRRRGSFFACQAVQPENRGHVCRCRRSVAASLICHPRLP